ncbi:hypothetical protein TNCV_1501021 [Trichonephila clavipes]|uniref:Uncharacterized protein n=1 Tax=Trichonephila clavipes TaxID=2585209 RepID=A0A8X6RTJ1_TRICX|nr:hypothetical protein TNCV_1501021 [Trichonephila clavipes]
MVFLDGQQRRILLRYGVSNFINEELGILSHFSSAKRVCGGGRRPATQLPKHAVMRSGPLSTLAIPFV